MLEKSINVIYCTTILKKKMCIILIDLGKTFLKIIVSSLLKKEIFQQMRNRKERV